MANAAVVAAGTSGGVNVFSTNNTDLVVDLNGYFAPAGTGGMSLYTLPPCRVLDTRQPPVSSTIIGEFDVSVLDGCGGRPSAQAYVFNTTVVPSGPLGYLTMWPQGTMRPAVATLNALDGAITNNMAIVPMNKYRNQRLCHQSDTTAFGSFLPLRAAKLGGEPRWKQQTAKVIGHPISNDERVDTRTLARCSSSKARHNELFFSLRLAQNFGRRRENNQPKCFDEQIVALTDGLLSSDRNMEIPSRMDVRSFDSIRRQS